MIEFQHVCKQFGRGGEGGEASQPRNGNPAGSVGHGRRALDDVSFSVGRGELAYLAGPSGAGKSTILKMLAGIEKPTSGTVLLNGQDIGRIGRAALPYLRRKLGLIFQEQQLLPDRTVLANVMLPMLVTGIARAEADKRARAALDKVGLLDKAGADPRGLSGGEQQRVAVARAIVNKPQVILADEPTANLDRHSAARVFDALRAFQNAGVTCLIATHDEHILEDAGRVIYLNRGRLVASERDAFDAEAQPA